MDIGSFFQDYGSCVLTGVLGALAGSGITIKLMSKRASNGSNIADQRGAKARGDIVGRNKIESQK